MARLEKRSLTRWENGVPKTYSKGDDVPDLESRGVTGTFLTQAEGAKVPGRKTTATPKTAPADMGTDPDNIGDGDLDIIELLEGNVPTVLSHISTEDRVNVLEDILVAEGEGKNRSTVTTAINDRIKALEEG
jgi:hypothetical protein